MVRMAAALLLELRLSQHAEARDQAKTRDMAAAGAGPAVLYRSSCLC